MSGGGPHFVDRMISRDKDMKDMAAAPAASDWFAMRIFCVVFLCFIHFFLILIYYFCTNRQNNIER